MDKFLKLKSKQFLRVPKLQINNLSSICLWISQLKPKTFSGISIGMRSSYKIGGPTCKWQKYQSWISIFLRFFCVDTSKYHCLFSESNSSINKIGFFQYDDCELLVTSKSGLRWLCLFFYASWFINISCGFCSLISLVDFFFKPNSSIAD